MGSIGILKSTIKIQKIGVSANRGRHGRATGAHGRATRCREYTHGRATDGCATLTGEKSYFLTSAFFARKIPFSKSFSIPFSPNSPQTLGPSIHTQKNSFLTQNNLIQITQNDLLHKSAYNDFLPKNSIFSQMISHSKLLIQKRNSNHSNITK